MKKVEITINGKAYPCRQTMGAMLRFKQETGKEVTDIEAGSLTDLCTFLWCCVVSASKNTDSPLTMSLMEFADSIAPEDMEAWAKTVAEQSEGADSEGGKEKKRK